MPAGASTAAASASIVSMPEVRNRAPLHRSHPRDHEKVAVREHLLLAGGAAPAGHDLEVAAIVAPRQRSARRTVGDTPIGDECAQPRASHLEQREEIVDGVRAERAVAEDEVDLIGTRDAEAIELVDICRELHEGGDTRLARQLRVLHPPAPVVVFTEEIGEADELLGCESGLEDDLYV